MNYEVKNILSKLPKKPTKLSRIELSKVDDIAEAINEADILYYNTIAQRVDEIQNSESPAEIIMLCNELNIDVQNFVKLIPPVDRMLADLESQIRDLGIELPSDVIELSGKIEMLIGLQNDALTFAGRTESIKDAVEVLSRTKDNLSN